MSVQEKQTIETDTYLKKPLIWNNYRTESRGKNIKICEICKEPYKKIATVLLVTECTYMTYVVARF